ncbi:MAG: type III pantothenate kinase [Luteibaculum sp.]
MAKTLILDVGNTRIKCGVFQDDQLLEPFVFNTLEELNQKFRPADFSHVAFSSVRDFELSEAWQAITRPLNFKAQLPINIAYSVQDQPGADRIANACYCYPESEKSPFLIIDAGTCVTYDVINTPSTFLGGAISLGLQSRLNAMHKFTGKLPLYNYAPLAGRFPYQSTRENMIGACIDGLAAEIEHYIALFSKQYSQGICVITGGDSAALHKALKSNIFADPNLTLKGIFNIFKYQYA